MLDVVLGGLRETAHEDLSRLARLDGMAFELTERGKRLRHELRKMLGERPFAALSAGAPISEIEKAHGDRVQARTAVDSLLLCDAIVTKTSLGRARRTAGARTIGQLRDHSAGRRRRRALRAVVRRRRTPRSARPRRARRRSSSTETPAPKTPAWCRRSSSPRSTRSASKSRRRAPRSPRSIQRLQGADHYAALLVDRDAKPDDIADSYQIKLALFERLANTITDPRDREKVDEIRTAYATAHAVLTDPRKRTRVRSRARGRRARPGRAGARYRAHVQARRRSDGEAGVDAGDRPLEDRDLAVAERGRLSRCARLGAVECRVRRRRGSRPATPRAATSTRRCRSIPTTRRRTTTRVGSMRRCASTIPARCFTSSARSISIPRAPMRSRRSSSCSSRAASCAGSSA